MGTPNDRLWAQLIAASVKSIEDLYLPSGPITSYVLCWALFLFWFLPLLGET